MRYTKRALLVFGAGLVLGFVAVVFGGFAGMGRLASGLMAAGLAALPVTAIVDWRRSAQALRRLERQAAGRPPRPAGKHATARLAAKRAAPKRPAADAPAQAPAKSLAKKRNARKPAGSRPS